MTKQHTPGPWICSIGDDERNPDVMQQGTFARIAVLTGMAPTEEMQANARVLATAPELLTALKDLINDINELAVEFGICQEIIESSYGKAASAAIKKATGG